MPTATLDLLKDIVFLLFFLFGTAWTWGWIKLPAAQQANLERIFQKSRVRYKWMFLIGTLLLSGLFLYQYFIER